MIKAIRTSTVYDRGKQHKVITYSTGQRVVIPVTKDGNVKWFDDSKLLKK